MKLNFTIECGPAVQGEAPQPFLLKSAVMGEAIGTYRCRLGIAKVWPTLQSDQELRTEARWGGPSGWPDGLELLHRHRVADGALDQAPEVVASGVQPS